MMKHIIVLLACIAALNAYAWNGVGHRAVAKLAWDDLSKKERAAATALLKQHPHYSNILTADVPAGVDTNEWAFLTAAVWPDLVRPAKAGQPPKPRSVTKYNVNPHAIDLPFLGRGETNRGLIRDFKKPDPDLRVVMSDAIRTLQNRKASAHDRAVSLSLILHLMADSHQPLHAAAMVTSERPKGYGGGGSLLVRNLRGEQSSYHTYWDSLPGDDMSYSGIVAYANALEADPALKKRRLPEYRKNRTPAAWTQESCETGANFAYAADWFRIVEARDLASGKVQPSEVPQVTPAFHAEAEKVAQRRLALARYRLTKVLKSTW